MKYEGKLYAKINGRHIECTQTVLDLEKKIKELEFSVQNITHQYCTVCGNKCEKDISFGFPLCDEHDN